MAKSRGSEHPGQSRRDNIRWTFTSSSRIEFTAFREHSARPGLETDRHRYIIAPIQLAKS